LWDVHRVLGCWVEGLTCGLREPKCVAKTGELTGVEEPEEDGEVGSPGKQTDDERATVPSNLCRDQHEALQECSEFHAQHAELVSPPAPIADGIKVENNARGHHA